MKQQHYCELFHTPFLPGTTHTLLEVIHSSNREHRHGLDSDCKPGFYSFFWMLTVPDGEELPNDFDELFGRTDDACGKGAVVKSKTFNQKVLDSVVKKSRQCIEEVRKVHANTELYKEVS